MKLADNTKEIIDIVSENDKIVGFGPKGQVHTEGKWHREIGVIIFDQHHRILLQRRSFKKHYGPGLWSISVTGHVHKGKSPLEAAHSELREELGFDTNLTFLEKRKMIYMDNKSFGYIYKGFINDNVPLIIDRGELEEAKFFNKNEYSILIDSGKVEPFSVTNLNRIAV